jgi:hypothetical protein
VAKDLRLGCPEVKGVLGAWFSESASRGREDEPCIKRGRGRMRAERRGDGLFHILAG